ncbi:GTPase [Cavenderia fasciculata]|uniref:GTPase n=1 Tax=Cavenderia fasciculata TaxID=261658 RepID=F4PXL1_CACFS|nr:GTPase [Cavenderia fasciculata]EGG19521.1 GTPase [Cavenderia fasciculata]|eukprot:XP_004357815.1 GTPase [Cavenderia fasciculata]
MEMDEKIRVYTRDEIVGEMLKLAPETLDKDNRYGGRVIVEHELQDRPPTAAELLSAHAQMRGFRTVHGVPDQSRSARIVLKDLVNGKLIYCCPPPGVDSHKFQRKNPKIRGAKTLIKDSTLDQQEEEQLRSTGGITAESKERKVTYDVSVESECAYDEQQGVVARLKSKKGQEGHIFHRPKFHHQEVSLSQKLDKLKLKEQQLKDLAIKQAKERILQQKLQQQQQEQQQPGIINKLYI